MIGRPKLQNCSAKWLQPIEYSFWQVLVKRCKLVGERFTLSSSSAEVVAPWRAMVTPLQNVLARATHHSHPLTLWRSLRRRFLTAHCYTAGGFQPVDSRLEGAIRLWWVEAEVYPASTSESAPLESGPLIAMLAIVSLFKNFNDSQQWNQESMHAFLVSQKQSIWLSLFQKRVL